MKIKHAFYLAAMLFGLPMWMQAQVGINTAKAQGVFYIDPKGDTNGNINVTDDVVIDNNGNVGIGTNNPQAKLDIRGKIRIADGTQKNGYTLTSDVDGNARWTAVQTNLSIAMDNFSSSGVSVPFTTANNSNIAPVKWFYCNTFLSIKPGKQLITASFYSDFPTAGDPTNRGKIKIVYRLSTSPTQLVHPVFVMTNGGQQITGICNLPNLSNSTIGFWLIENKQITPINLYLFVSVYFPTNFNTTAILFKELGGSKYLETIVTVTPINIL